MGPSAYARIVGIMSGRSIASRDWQQPAKTLRPRDNHRGMEGNGSGA